MARQPTPPKQSRVLARDGKIAAIARLESRIGELRELRVDSLQRGDDSPASDIASRIQSTLANIYGQGSVEYDRLAIACDLDASAYLYMQDT